MVGEHRVERVDVEAEDVVQVVQVVEVLGHKVLQLVQAAVAGGKKEENEWSPHHSGFARETDR